jgi:IS66 Orf2 like protein
LPARRWSVSRCRTGVEGRSLFRRPVRLQEQAPRLFEDFDLGGSGLCLFTKRLENGKFVWPPIVDGSLRLTLAQLALLIEGIDWRRTVAPGASEQRSLVCIPAGPGLRYSPAFREPSQHCNHSRCDDFLERHIARRHSLCLHDRNCYLSRREWP